LSTATFSTGQHHSHQIDPILTGKIEWAVNGEGYSKGTTAIVCVAMGYIGKSVVWESVRQVYRTVALMRDPLKAQSEETLPWATFVQ
jgi:hypothetical protein